MLDKCARRCCVCFRINFDFSVKLGQIAHLDRDPSNNRESNLAYLCFDHHSQYDSITRQHKNYSITEVKSARRELCDEVERKRRLNPGKRWAIVVDGEFEDFDRARVQAMAEHLRRLLRDPHLTIEKIEEGSVRLMIRSERRPFDLETIQEFGRSFGLRILEVWDFDLNSTEGFKEFQNYVTALCRKNGLAESDAEDIAIEASLRALSRPGPRPGSLLTSVRAVAHNAVRERLKKDITLADSELDELSSEEGTPPESNLHLFPQERTIAVQETLDRMAPRLKEVIALYYFQELSKREIAEILGVSTGTVGARLRKAREAFRLILGLKAE